MRLITKVNGEIRQDASTSRSHLRHPDAHRDDLGRLTLEPGDIIATGTPAGVGIGFTPPKFIKPGDVIEVTIEPIGTLCNPVA